MCESDIQLKISAFMVGISCSGELVRLVKSERLIFNEGAKGVVVVDRSIRHLDLRENFVDGFLSCESVQP